MTTQKDNSGVLFQNTYRTEENKQPHYKGKATVNGVEYKLSAWLNYSKEGSEYISIKVEELGEFTVPGTFPKSSTAAAPARVKPDDNDIPF